eukprot:749322-Hanusia_phi.AAC.2
MERKVNLLPNRQTRAAHSQRHAGGAGRGSKPHGGAAGCERCTRGRGAKKPPSSQSSLPLLVIALPSPPPPSPPHLAGQTRAHDTDLETLEALTIRNAELEEEIRSFRIHYYDPHSEDGHVPAPPPSPPLTPPPPPTSPPPAAAPTTTTTTTTHLRCPQLYSETIELNGERGEEDMNHLGMRSLLVRGEGLTLCQGCGQSCEPRCRRPT